MGWSRRRMLGAGASLGASAVGAACLGRRRPSQEARAGVETDSTVTPNASVAGTKVLVAGSLLSLASEVANGRVEAHGSLAVRQLIRDGLRDPDAVALADPRLFAGLSETVTLFATNALVVAYDPDSPYADAIRDDWAGALASEGLTWGRTDPATDPLGYRTLLALELAENEGRLSRASVLEHSTVLPETGLARAVGTAKVDAAVTYRNMAVEQGLPAVDLPSTLDFSDPSKDAHYRSVSVEVGEEPYASGAIRYGVTGLTPNGSVWVDRLVGDPDRLRAHGFGVPASYPKAVTIGER